MSDPAISLVGLADRRLDPQQQRYLRLQVAAAVPINALLGGVFVWLVFGGQDRIQFWGTTGLAADLVPTTFMITLMTTLGLTLATRAALRSGKLTGTPYRRAPRNVLLRALTFASLATLVLVPLSVILLWAAWSGNWSYSAVLWFKIAYAVLLGLLITPVIVRSALADGARAAR